MQILLINPRTDDRQRPPLGLAYIAALLKKNGFSVAIFDPVPSKTIEKKLLGIMGKYRPKIVGITATTAQIFSASIMAREIKKRYPSVKIIVGGPHVTVLPKEVAKNPNVDFAVFGEGEYTALELCKAILNKKDVSNVKGICFEKNGKIVQTDPRPLIENLDNLPFPARELLDREWYAKRGSMIRGLWMRTATMMTSRGCPGRCIYCASKLTFGRKTRRRSVANVMKEIKELIRKDNIKGLFFCDDTITIGQEWMSDFCTEMKKLDRRLVWGCQSRVNTINEKMLREMKKAGCVQMEFGCESGSPKVLKALKKFITVGQIRNAFKLTKKIGIRAMANFMIGNPEETVEDVEMTAKLAKELNADYTEFWITTPYPGSELYKEAKEKGWLKKAPDWDRNWAHGYTSSEPVMEINFTAEQLIKMRERLYVGSFSSMLKSSLMSPSFLYDSISYMVTHPGDTLNAIGKIPKGGLVMFGLYIEKKMRGSKKDIILESP